MKLALATTSLLALQGGAFSPQKTAQSGPLNGLKPLTTSTGARANGASVPFLRTASNQAGASLTALSAAQSNDAEDAKKSGADNTEGSEDSASCNDYLMLDELKSLGSKYQDLINKDAKNFVDAQLGLWMAAGSEKLEKFAEEHSEVIDTVDKVVDSIDDVIKGVDEVKEWVQSTREFAKSSAPQFLKVNTTEVTNNLTASLSQKVESKMDEIRQKVADLPVDQLAGLKGQISALVNQFIQTNSTVTNSTSANSTNSGV